MGNQTMQHRGGGAMLAPVDHHIGLWVVIVILCLITVGIIVFLKRRGHCSVVVIPVISP